ncbi:MAG: hypothetical protein JWR80_2895 [Bradyrhizobium sp.]|nr:hypothetical protein [Bradyrhizobium sp.]
MATRVYCDDAGFTGDNLLDTAQPFFGYAAVAIAPDEAAALVEAFRQRFGLVGAEIKGRFVYRRPDALEAISWLLGELGDRASVAVSDKLYSLAAKFFEYVFEPVIARNSMFFYERGFHLHVSTMIWAYLVSGDSRTARIVSRFDELLRRRSGAPQLYFDRAEDDGAADAIGTIRRFAAACRPEIEAELANLADADGRIQWVLDLSFSSAKSVLCTMGERFGQLDVVFDDSKPLAAYRHFFDGFVGRSEIPRLTFRGRDAPLTFNLAKPVTFASSLGVPGLQLADLVASFSALASRDRHAPKGAAILDACLPWFNDDSIWPDLDHLRLDRKDNFLNAVLLLELTVRAEEGRDMLRDLPGYCAFMAERFDAEPPSKVLPG